MSSTSTPAALAGTGSERIATIDGLRGIAALLVVLFHLHEAVSRTATDWLWGPIDWIARNGFKGVDIFFVISGFVIALSVSKGAPTFSYLGRFIARRSIRLDPPYWVSIAIELALIAISARVLAAAVTWPDTSIAALLSHVFYAQEILGYGSIVAVYWTLCYEIQFYIAFVLLVVLQAKLPASPHRSAFAAGFAAALFVTSVGVMYWRPDGFPNGVALDRWFQFFVGVLTYRAVAGYSSMRPLIAACAVIVAAVLLSGSPVTHLIPVGVAGWLVLCSRDMRWGKLLAAKPVRALGLISYSIYLFHASIGWRFVSLMQRLIPGNWTSGTAILVYLAGIVLSVGAAAVLWWLVERPCLRLCQRVKLPRRAYVERPAAEQPVTAPVAAA